MYDWLTWADVWSGFILKDVILKGTLPSMSLRPPQPMGYRQPKSFTELVHRMHASVNFFLRPQGDYTDDDMQSHAYDLLLFAQSVEVTFGVGPATTFNLHVAVCRLPDQIKCRG